MTVMDGVPDKNSSLSIISYEKASQVFEEKELDKHSAVRNCQAGGSGEGEWLCIKLAWVFKYILVHVCIGMAIKLFFGTKVRFGVPANSSGIRILRTTPNYVSTDLYK